MIICQICDNCDVTTGDNYDVTTDDYKEIIILYNYIVIKKCSVALKFNQHKQDDASIEI